MLGWHWLAQVDRVAPERLGDAQGLALMLGELAQAMQLTPVGEPLVRAALGGPAAVLLLAESHAAVHTDLASGSAMVDVFSCREVNGDAAAAVVRRRLGGELSWTVVARGGAAVSLA